MLGYLRSLISETGTNSMTRFLSLVCVVTAVVIAVLGLALHQNPDALIGLCATFLGAGLGAKVLQRSIESKEVDASEAPNEDLSIVAKAAPVASNNPSVLK